MGNYQWLLVFPRRPAGSAKNFIAVLLTELRRMFLGVPEATTLEVVGSSGTLAEIAEAYPIVPEPADTEAAPATSVTASSDGTARSLADPTGFDLPELPPEVIEFRFVPFWEVQSELITSNVCQATLLNAGGDIRLGIDTLESREDYEALSLLDRNALSTAVKALHTLLVAGAPIEMIVPLHYGPMNVVQHRMRYLELLHQVPVRLRRWVLLQLSEVPAGAPAKNILEITSGLRPNCRDVIAVQRSSELNPAIFRQAPITTVGVSLTDLTFASMDELRFRVEDAAIVIMQAGFTPFFVDVRRPQTALFASQAGAGHVSGPFATGASPEPLPPKFMNLSDATAAAAASN
jgi:hypothetical protein